MAVNNPDKIIFVGEALVGNEAVDQLTKFDRALRDFSSASGSGRGMDGMLVTKWDTVDDKVCKIPVGREYPNSLLPIHLIGWSGALDDICHWSAYHICWLWTGIYAAPHPDIVLTNILAHIDLHRLEATEGGQCGVSDSQ